jgi:Tfp pilus assembly protein PilF
LTLGQRAGNALVSVSRYLAKTVRPVDLSAFYPHPGDWPLWQVVASGALVLIISVLATWQARRRPYQFVGWFWFLGMLVPVSGIVQAGLQSMADRYTYLTSLGLLIAAVWGVAELARVRPRLKPALRPAFAAVLLGLAVCTWLQQRYWATTLDLFQHALVVDPNNWQAHNMVGLVYSAQGDEAAAVEHLGRAVELNPDHPEPRHNYGWSLYRLGRVDEAVDQYRAALHIRPDLAITHFTLGVALASAERYKEAYAEFAEAARLAPDNPNVHVEWGRALAAAGDPDAAAARFAKAMEMDPTNEGAREGLAGVREPGVPDTKPATVPSG